MLQSCSSKCHKAVHNMLFKILHLCHFCPCTSFIPGYYHHCCCWRLSCSELLLSGVCIHCCLLCPSVSTIVISRKCYNRDCSKIMLLCWQKLPGQSCNVALLDKNVHALYHNMYCANKISVVVLSVGMVLNCFLRHVFDLEFAREVGKKIFGGFPKGWKQNSRGSGGHSSPDTEGYIPFLHYFRSSFY